MRMLSVRFWFPCGSCELGGTNVMDEADDFRLGATERLAPSLRSTPRRAVSATAAATASVSIESGARGVFDRPRGCSDGDMVADSARPRVMLVVLELGSVAVGKALTVGVLSDDDASGDAIK
jgi:hypothetical protein